MSPLRFPRAARVLRDLQNVNVASVPATSTDQPNRMTIVAPPIRGRVHGAEVARSGMTADLVFSRAASP
jgi:hypothetical protein